jgi:hypothetical protein
MERFMDAFRGSARVRHLHGFFTAKKGGKVMLVKRQQLPKK